MAEQPNDSLSGCRVLDIAAAKGMFCTRLLADMGAAVTRIEPPGAPREDAKYGYLNAGKKIMHLDLRNKAGQAAFRALVKEVDVLVEDFAPGHLESIGLDYGRLSGINPGLVMASITGFGQAGPHRDWQASDLVAQATGGWLSVTGEPERPLKLYGDQSYYTASLFAANGIVLALLARRAAGRGQHLGISLQECVAATLDHVLVRYFHQGEVAGRTGSRYWNGAFRILPCRDGHVLVAWQQHWDTLVEWLAAEAMAADLADEKWQDPQVRLAEAGHIAAVLEKWTLAHTAAELVEKAQLMRFPWAKVNTVADIKESPQHAARNFWRTVKCPQAGDNHQAPGPPLGTVP